MDTSNRGVAMEPCRRHAAEQTDQGRGTAKRVKEERDPSVACKVPRFQYVDFPSLHQCIQQLAVPPLDSWRPPATPLIATTSTTTNTTTVLPAAPAEPTPKFQYVDFPSLHHCIQQLSVPPLEIWSSGLVRAGLGTSSVPASKRERSRDVPRLPKPAAPPGAGGGLLPRKREPTRAKGWQGERRSDTSPALTCRRTDPESVCPFCQKMFADPEELKVHEKGHRGKVCGDNAKKPH